MLNRLGAALVAEFVGTFALCFVGILAIHNGSTVGLVGIALAHGLILSVMVTAAITLQRAAKKCRTTASGRKTKINSDELNSIGRHRSRSAGVFGG